MGLLRFFHQKFAKFIYPRTVLIHRLFLDHHLDEIKRVLNEHETQ